MEVQVKKLIEIVREVEDGREIRITDTEEVPEAKRWMSDFNLMDAAVDGVTVNLVQISTYRDVVYLSIAKEDYDRMVNRWFI